ncbi:hypothetical protein K435DRAFT_781451 [Dendrothele bispora CBS 962.96]|uniref:DNA helicase n=1 Tax=Dendrothele bispora (strain CBS 962.96) TaxID=1314807 RepID=A0A4S8LM17_DENBC|nr:hypothetical protein K435DRAFT_781451 [Dendrothele bispora CBS 962.96]
MPSSRTTRTSIATHLNHGESEKYEESRSPGSWKDKRNDIQSIVTKGQELDTAKEALLVRKQMDLESIYQRHDGLVREIFHMEHFRSMIGYDPEEAKNDDSAVFRDYKSTSYDILNKAASTSASVVGLSRRTRSAQQHDRMQLLQSSVSAPPSNTLPVKTSSKAKRKRKDNSSVWDILAHAKTKNKGKEKAEDVTADWDASRRARVADVGESISVHPREGKMKRIQSKDLNLEPPSISRNASRSMSTTSSFGGSKHFTPAASVAAVPARGKRRKVDDGAPALSNNIHDPGGSVAGSSQETKLSTNSSRRTISIPAAKDRTTISGIPSTQSTAQSSVLPSPSNIRRIKLIVRRPPPLLSSPRQKPPPPQYNGSISNLLHSFTMLGDQEADEGTIQKQVHAKASLLEKTSKLRKEGRYFPDAESLAVEVSTLSGTNKLERLTKDIWDHCIEDAIRYRESQIRAPSGQQIAGQIAAKIRAYWEVQAVKQEKWKVQEEKRLRALAKATIKIVTTEWKKAVFHLREQERLRREAEELRRGHEHLDAILNQSGQILETQHIDLSKNDRSRSHSRASSKSTDLEYWNQPDDDGSGSSENTDSDDESSDDRSEAEGDTEDTINEGNGGKQVPTSMMLMQLPAASSARASPASEVGATTLELREILGSPSTGAGSTAELNVDEILSSSNQDGGHAHSLDRAGILTVNGNSDFAVLNPSPTVAQDKHESPMAVRSSVSTDDVGSPKLSSRNSPAAEMNILSPPSSPSVSDAETSRQLYDQSKGSFATVPVDINSVESDGVNLGQDATSQNSAELDEDELPDSSAAPEDGTQPADDTDIPEYLKPYLVAPVQRNPESKMSQPLLLRGILRPYQFSGLEWLASLHSNNLNGILADEMGLGKTIQTISLLAHLACDRGIWGPHLIIVPTSVLLNWEMEFKKFLPGFRILSYHGNTKRRKELRQGWNDKLHFNVCITSYTLASRDAHIFKRKAWYYMILDEAHMIKNFKSQRWNILLMFRSFRRLLLTGTPLQNNLTELWALLQFLMSGTNFANLKEFGDWFSNPLEKAIEMGSILDDETMQRVSKLHTVLRPYLLRRLKRDVEKELPSKYEHLVLCPLSKRQRFLYDEFMSRAQTQDALQSGVYQKIANILMQLRKVCNHPDLFEVRPIVTSFAMQRSAVSDFEIKELLIRRRLLYTEESEMVNLDALGFLFINQQGSSLITALETRRLDATQQLLAQHTYDLGVSPPRDTRTIKGFKVYSAWQRRAKTVARWAHIGYLNKLRCNNADALSYSSETLSAVQNMYEAILPARTSESGSRTWAPKYMDTVMRVRDAVLSYSERAESLRDIIEKFAFVTPPVVALDLPRITIVGESASPSRSEELIKTIRALPHTFDAPLHLSAVKLQIAFPDPSLLQYDCGKLQVLSQLLREKKAGGHRVLIFTQMTRILDLLEIFLNFHGWLYLRLDGATKIEDRQYITERFNRDDRVFCFISSSRSGGVGINLTGADTVIFYDSDFNPQMDRQCEDRAHRIGQIRDVHIYRFVSQHTVEEAMLRKANQKRSLDDLVIQRGGFDWRVLFGGGEGEEGDDNSTADNSMPYGQSLLTKALEEFEDAEDTNAARVAEKEEGELVGADEADFGNDDRERDGLSRRASKASTTSFGDGDEDIPVQMEDAEDIIDAQVDEGDEDVEGEAEEEGDTIVDYMLAFVRFDAEFFESWSIR